MGVNWAQIIRYHPEYLRNYEVLYKKNFFFLFVLLRFLKFSFFIVQTTIKSLFNLDNYRNKINNKDNLDIIIISHFINKKHMRDEDDFYFGSLPKKLLKEDLKTNIFLINHTKISSQIIENSWINSDVNRYVSSRCLNFRDEVRIILNGFKILLNLFFKSNINKDIVNRVRFLTSVEAISPASLDAERIARQLESYVKKTKPKVIIFTFEGHAWERLVIQKVKNLNIRVLCIAYVHTLAFPNQHASITNFQNQFMPDFILVTGNETKKIFEKNLLSSIPIKVLGSLKKMSVCKKPDKKEKVKILILPEAFSSETNLLLNLGLKLAKQHKNVYVRIRRHPNMLDLADQYKKLLQSKKINNIKVSTYTLSKDIDWSSHALYRGSTSIIQAVSSGVLPIYYRLKNELTIDPLFNKEDRSYYVSSIADISLMLDNWKKMSSKQEIKRKREFIQFCKNLVQPLNINVLKKVIEN